MLGITIQCTNYMHNAVQYITIQSHVRQKVGHYICHALLGWMKCISVYLIANQNYPMTDPV